MSSSLVVVFVLLATRHYYPRFEESGRWLAWLVIVGCFAALLSLMVSLLRLYVRPAVNTVRQNIDTVRKNIDTVRKNGRARRTRKRNA